MQICKTIGLINSAIDALDYLENKFASVSADLFSVKADII